MNNVVNQVAYLVTSREFPEDGHELTVHLNKSYSDIANAVNFRTIGIFPSTRPAITGESWFIFQNKRQQSLRQVYTFTSIANIPHGLNLDRLDYFTRNFGEYTDGTNWYGIIHGTDQPIPGQLSFYVSPTEIVFVDGGAGRPPLTKGLIVLEWLSVP